MDHFLNVKKQYTEYCMYCCTVLCTLLYYHSMPYTHTHVYFTVYTVYTLITQSILLLYTVVLYIQRATTGNRRVQQQPEYEVYGTEYTAVLSVDTAVYSPLQYSAVPTVLYSRLHSRVQYTVYSIYTVYTVATVQQSTLYRVQYVLQKGIKLTH